VGETDLSEFLMHLKSLYMDHNSARRAGGEAPASTYLGLVTIGHSFGGQVVIRTIAQGLEHDLEGLQPASAYLHETGDAPALALSSAQPGYGDLVLLINPAVEAAAYERLRLLSKRFTYSEQQTPWVLTLSAENDVPRHRLFEWGRLVGEIFMSAPHISDERERYLERQALGFYDKALPQGTHIMMPVDSGAHLTTVKQGAALGARSSDPPEAGCAAPEFYDWVPTPTLTDDDSLPSGVRISDDPELAGKIARFDFSSKLVFGNVRMVPQPNREPFQPLILADVSRNVIAGHTGIFSEPLIGFLTKYIGFVEAKHYLIAAGEKGWMTPP
jgi:hypothetical protein